MVATKQEATNWDFTVGFVKFWKINILIYTSFNVILRLINSFSGELLGLKHLCWLALLLNLSLQADLTNPKILDFKSCFFSPAAMGHMHLMVYLRGTACFSSWSVLRRGLPNHTSSPADRHITLWSPAMVSWCWAGIQPPARHEGRHFLP